MRRRAWRLAWKAYRRGKERGREASGVLSLLRPEPGDILVLRCDHASDDAMTAFVDEVERYYARLGKDPPLFVQMPEDGDLALMSEEDLARRGLVRLDLAVARDVVRPRTRIEAPAPEASP